MSENEEGALDEMTRVQTKTAAMGLVLSTLIDRLAEQMPEMREDVQRDVPRILTTMTIESPSKRLLTDDVTRTAESLMSVSNV